jgi:hypothetical protein
MAEDRPQPLWSPRSQYIESNPVLRIVWMAEDDVNADLMNELIGSLAALSTAAHTSWNSIETTDPPFSKEIEDAERVAANEIRDAINDLTVILVDPVQVLNKQRNRTFVFRLGQCVDESQLSKLIRLVDSVTNNLPTAPMTDQWDLLRHGTMWLKNWQDETLPGVYRDLFTDVLKNGQVYEADISPSLRDRIANTLLVDLGQITQSAESTLEHIDNAAGKVGAKTLAQGFYEQTEREARRAGWWTFGVVSSVTLGIVFPVLALTTEKIVFSTTVDATAGTIIKALIGLPLFALAAYFGRISSQHRETERYLRILTTQINSVQAYADVLPQPERGHLINSLGLRAFSNPGFTTTDKGKVNAIPEDVAELLDKAMELAKGAK